ncbi:TauD/TfdA dioxygenase family protein [Candidatus Poriferisocius sp.]|uniref:TauD/TfdA dioxygenase family protein n=1 Tax=Candidatus Poriferisocius sp. TaxID=3101276 RepID=UPI003B02E041
MRRLPEGWMPAQFRRFEVSPVAPTIGAELSGLSLEDVDDELFAELDQALLEWKVLIVRGQPIDVAAQGALALRWGPLTDDQLIPNPGTAAQTDAITFERNDTVVGLENMWHTDGTFRTHPPVCTILRAIEIPSVGGDTLFADMAAAWDNLDPDLQDRLTSLSARHDWSIGAYADKYGDDLDKLRAEVPPAVHPVARPHPRTGRLTLFVNAGFTTDLVGRDGSPVDNSDELLNLLCRQAEIPEYHCRVRWSPDTVVIWDNQAVQHYGINDYHPARRVMSRASVAGS